MHWCYVIGCITCRVIAHLRMCRFFCFLVFGCLGFRYICCLLHCLWGHDFLMFRSRCLGSSLDLSRTRWIISVLPLSTCRYSPPPSPEYHLPLIPNLSQEWYKYFRGCRMAGDICTNSSMSSMCCRIVRVVVWCWLFFGFLLVEFGTIF